jgi:predicted nucleotidyltransferase
MSWLKGTNRIDTFRMVANEIVQRVSHFGSVCGILYMGGLVRGFADQYSDVDIIVLLNNEDPFTREFLPSISATLEDKSNLEIDLEVYLMAEYALRDWDEYTKWDLTHSEIAYDRHGNTKAMLNEKLHMSDDDWKLRLSKSMVYFSWYCCPSEDYIPTMSDMWFQRGDEASAEYSVTYGIELLLSMVYSLNRSFLPAPKWRISYTNSLDWLPSDFESNLREAMITKEISEDDTKRRAAALTKLWPEVLEKAENDFGLNREEARRVYIKDAY